MTLPTRSLGVRHFQALMMFLRVMLFALDKILVSTVVEELTRTGLLEKQHVKLKRYLFQPCYILSLVLGGLASVKFNNKTVLLVSRASAMVLYYAAPSLVHWQGGWMFLALGSLVSLLSGFTLPCVFNILASWIPRDDLDTATTLVFNGLHLGKAAMLTLGVDIAGKDGEAWSSFLYVGANLELFWCLAYWIFGSEGPEDCWFIGREDRLRLSASVGPAQQRATKIGRIPWSRILTNGPFIAMSINRFAQVFSVYSTARFLEQVSQSIFQTESGFTLIYLPLVRFVSGTVFVVILHFTNKEKISKKNLRYTLSSIAHYGGGICLIFLANSQSYTSFLVFPFLLHVINPLQILGSIANVFDHTVKFVGLISGLAFAVASIGYILGPVIFEFFLNSFDSELGWRCAYFFCAVVLFFGNFVFTTFGSVKMQSYDTYYEIGKSDRTS